MTDCPSNDFDLDRRLAEREHRNSLLRQEIEENSKEIDRILEEKMQQAERIIRKQQEVLDRLKSRVTATATSKSGTETTTTVSPAGHESAAPKSTETGDNRSETSHDIEVLRDILKLALKHTKAPFDEVHGSFILLGNAWGWIQKDSVWHIPGMKALLEKFLKKPIGEGSGNPSLSFNREFLRAVQERGDDPRCGESVTKPARFLETIENEDGTKKRDAILEKVSEESSSGHRAYYLWCFAGEHRPDRLSELEPLPSQRAQQSVFWSKPVWESAPAPKRKSAKRKLASWQKEETAPTRVSGRVRARAEDAAAAASPSSADANSCSNSNVTDSNCLLERMVLYILDVTFDEQVVGRRARRSLYFMNVMQIMDLMWRDINDPPDMRRFRQTLNWVIEDDAKYDVDPDERTLVIEVRSSGHRRLSLKVGNDSKGTAPLHRGCWKPACDADAAAADRILGEQRLILDASKGVNASRDTCLVDSLTALKYVAMELETWERKECCAGASKKEWTNGPPPASLVAMHKALQKMVQKPNTERAYSAKAQRLS